MENTDNSLAGFHEKYKRFFTLEKPYGFMIEELVHSLYAKNDQVQGNYLTALGLFCYSEVIGREIMSYKDSSTNKERFKNQKCFDLFLGEYMGYQELLVKYPNIYDWYRNGLCHNYKIKGSGNSETGVFVYYDPPSILEFKRVGIDTTKGILLSQKSQKRHFILRPYLEDFIKGIKKFLHEKASKSS